MPTPPLPSVLQAFTHFVPSDIPDEDTDDPEGHVGMGGGGHPTPSSHQMLCTSVSLSGGGLTAGSRGGMLHISQEGIQLSACPTPPQAYRENACFVQHTQPIVRPPASRWGLSFALHAEPGTALSPLAEHMYLTFIHICVLSHQGKAHCVTLVHPPTLTGPETDQHPAPATLLAECSKGQL